MEEKKSTKKGKRDIVRIIKENGRYRSHRHYCLSQALFLSALVSYHTTKETKLQSLCRRNMNHPKVFYGTGKKNDCMCNIYCMLTDNVSEEGEEEQEVLCHPHQREIVCDIFCSERKNRQKTNEWRD